MSSSLVLTLVLIAAVVWLAYLGVSALRSRGPEDVPPNLKPGDTDEELETRRLERLQQAAVLASAFLAIGLPLYYLGEPQRQEGFVEQFHEESVTRGEHLVEEFGCYNCHGPGGSGGVASYVEKRTGVTVAWVAPSLDDIFYRYDRDEVRYWITYGRPNTPMPAWGVAGGGPMNEAQVEDILNYLETHQISQEEAAARVDQQISAELDRLANADTAMERLILQQRQLIADLERSQELAPIFAELDARAADLEANLAEGLDTDGDGVADVVEEETNRLTAEAVAVYRPEGLEPLSLDPSNPETTGVPDLEAVEQILATMQRLVDQEVAPILTEQINAITAILERQPAEDDVDTDGDGLTDSQETEISGQVQAAIDAVTPDDLIVTSLDPTNPASQGGEPDATTAMRALAAVRTRALNLGLQVENYDRIYPPAVQGLEELRRLQRERRWEFDFEAIAAEVFDGDVDKARRVVGIFQAFCARCHTSGFSAGVPFAQEAGSGAFGPALWEGREAVQFLTDQQLVDFLVSGSEDGQAYGVNGVGSGRMPGFGMILSEEDLTDLARWLRAGDLTGQGGDS
ncbi:MAG: hypothetical protein KatS3mg011_0441 [Acidimicrobiia bacterium]|nr:MAG: hypothetical protein KatS3mg011_0441 [Acidimicrobiia bacterium]